MILQRFYYNIIFRIILLSVTALLFTWSWTNINNLFTFVTTGILFAIQVILLIFFINRVNRDLNQFFISLKSGDLTTGITGSAKQSMRESLQKIVHEILQSIEKVKIEREYHYQYLQQVVEHVDVGLISFEKNGRVDIANRAIKSMLKLHSIKNIKNLNTIHTDFENNLNQIKSGQHRMMVIDIGENILHLILRSTEFKLNEKKIKLVSVQNIQTELDEKELTSWQKLIRVLTHEIMNSVSPISSLATTLLRIFMIQNRTVEVNELKKNQVDDAARGLEIIGKRSKGLLQFVKQYRKINLLPKPDSTSFSVSKLFSHIQILFKDEIAKQEIHFQSVITPRNLELIADEQMIEQVLINLINNSIFATKDIAKPIISLKAFVNKDGQLVIQISDNGSGIPDEIRDSIFVPFFTTRENGSGIGLTLARQIMHLHQGNITYQSSPKEETTFNLIFLNRIG